MVLSIIGFSIAAYTNEYWRSSYYMIFGIILCLLITPVYVSVLLARLNKALLQANAANEEKDRFIATMSHELRTPLTGVITASRLIDQNTLTPQNSNLLGTIKNSSNELLTLINQVLAFSKTESSNNEDNTTHFFPYALIKECLSILQPEADKKEIDLHVSLHNDFHLAVISNEQKLRQILINIIGNAVKFTQEGHVCVELGILIDTENIPQLQIVVRDTGSGISEADQQTVFEPFKQADQGITRKHEGSGLGTTISKRFIEELSGSINLSSEQGVGTNVTISLPVQLSDLSQTNIISDKTISLVNFENIPVRLLRATEDASSTLLENDSLNADILIQPFTNEDGIHITDQSGNSNSSVILNKPDSERITYAIGLLASTSNSQYSDATQPEIPNSVIGKRILIVDDNLTNRTIIEMVLQEIGTETTTANDGPQAIKLMQEQRYDLFIFDRHMPEMSGNELLSESRKIYKTDNLKAILLTADISEEASEEAISSGFGACVHKPFEPSLLIDEVEKLFTA